MAELFTDRDILKDVNSIDTTLMERISLIDTLSKEEQKTIFSIMDAFLSKRKLKTTLKTVLNDIQ
ncbi:hypothetical protein BST94_03850 [Nonlabens xylanidelens]|nr:hypothetical protein BST94_06710 [Nonlabens xylanidelens]PQJ19535.1 hypothetical protein BST94_06665 [Nonlabens xylanidelens]PQJ19553.1 hypothetical protein BST94_06620 [Nonlabens xylanidelens]PQJ19641.1 hypothetical protein BST94_06540 [Nonlabens xylanidelens]PQJ22015.1 hypothetical protein BST94_03850 [Nonlabens xylanidelens]